jgi:hypothetical protein
MRRALASSPGTLYATLAGLALATPRTLLAAPPDCSSTTDTIACRLDEFLNWLHFAAGALGLLLVVVLIVAVRIFRHKRNSDDPLFRKETSRKDSSR